MSLLRQVEIAGNEWVVDLQTGQPAMQDGALSTDTARRRGSTDAGHHQLGQTVWALRLQALQGAIAAGGLPRLRESSRAEPLLLRQQNPPPSSG